MKPLHILIIDDEETQLMSLKSFLSRRNHFVETTTSGKNAIEIITENPIDLVLSDYRMPAWDGQKVLTEVKAFNPEIDVVIMTAYGTIENAVDLMKAGAYDFLSKPVDLANLENLITRLAAKRELESENRNLKAYLKHTALDPASDVD